MDDADSWVLNVTVQGCLSDILLKVKILWIHSKLRSQITNILPILLMPAGASKSSNNTDI